MIERFREKYVVDIETGCWVWTAGTFGTGYPLFGVDGAPRRAHRVSYGRTCRADNERRHVEKHRRERAA